MKRKIFIGSSTEGLVIANKVKNEINSKLGYWVECEIWNEGTVFTANKGTLESLIKAARKYDYGIFIASNDDKLIKRGKQFKTMRDNVLFESGLFLGSLGLQRAFLLTHSVIKLPSDFNGTSIETYDEKNIDAAINKVIDTIQLTKDSFTLKPIPSTAIAFGYFENFVLPFANKCLKNKEKDFSIKLIIPKNIKDIDNSIEYHKTHNPSITTDGERPIANKYLNNQNQYWDIPTTLKTLNQLIDMFLLSPEIGINTEKEEWLQHEIRNFKGTLEVLIKQHDIFKGHISIEWI